MAGDKRQGSGSSGKPKIAAIPCPSARLPPPARRKQAQRTPCRSIPSFPAFLFAPSAHAPPPPPECPAPKMGSGAHSWPRLFLGTYARSGAGAAVKWRLGCLGAARAAGTNGRSLWSLSARVRMCEVPGPKVSRGMVRTVHLLCPEVFAIKNSDLCCPLITTYCPQ